MGLKSSPSPSAVASPRHSTSGPSPGPQAVAGVGNNGGGNVSVRGHVNKLFF